ncbi:hypothetical protein [Changchengzhania lutea]|uniref:hypothetical protein n=1 Tax=Changchengzhania lutea TaxID=2049305 RepID=UPI00115F6F03|nr:hypothetical protein [Changchengzhania lutea]
MRHLFLTILIVLMSFTACKKNSKANIGTKDESINSQEVMKSDLEKLKFVEYVLDLKTELAIQDWQDYYQLNDVIINVKKGDLSFFNDNNDAILLLLKNLKDNIPDQVNTDATLARIAALETKLFKLQSLSNLQTTTQKKLKTTIEEFLETFSNLNFQMNKKLEKDNQQIEKP